MEGEGSTAEVVLYPPTYAQCGTCGHSSLSEPLLWAKAGAQLVERLWSIQETLDPILATLPWGWDVHCWFQYRGGGGRKILHYAASLRSDSQQTTTTKELSLMICHPSSWGSWGRRIEVQGLHGLQSKCKANLGSLVKPCSQRKNEKRARSPMGQSLRWKESVSIL